MNRGVLISILRTKKSLKMKSLFIMILILLLNGCQKTIWVPSLRYPDFKVNQRQETTTAPAKFYVCGNALYPCRSITPKWQGKVKLAIHKKRSLTRNKLTINNSKEHQDEKPQTVKSCKIYR